MSERTSGTGVGKRLKQLKPLPSHRLLPGASSRVVPEPPIQPPVGQEPHQPPAHQAVSASPATHGSRPESDFQHERPRDGAAVRSGRVTVDSSAPTGPLDGSADGLESDQGLDKGGASWFGRMVDETVSTPPAYASHLSVTPGARGALVKRSTPLVRVDSSTGLSQQDGRTELQHACRDIYAEVASKDVRTKAEQPEEEGTEAVLGFNFWNMRMSNRQLSKRERILLFVGGIMQGAARFLLGGRTLAVEEPNTPNSDLVRFQTRTEAVIMYSIGGVIIFCTLSALATDEAHPAAIAIGFLGAGTLLLALCAVHLMNRLRLTRLRKGITLMVLVKVVLAFLVPFGMHIGMGGLGHSYDIFLWTTTSPIAAVFLFHDHPMLLALVMVLARTMAIVVVAVLEQREWIDGDNTDIEKPSATGGFALIFTHLLCPLIVAACFRRSTSEFLWWRESWLSMSQQLSAQRNHTERLLHSAVPPRRAKRLRNTRPSKWCRMRPDDYQDCTVVQMDIKGFTAMSSSITADELVDLVNAIFTSIDKAAELIGKVWKVETIGDCYQVIIGGPFPCHDHAQRGMQLAYAILQLMHCISDRLEIPVTCRCSVHTGQVCAAVMGSLLPRYLVYGPDVTVARKMEATAEVGSIQVSEATRRQLGANTWRFSDERMTTFPGEIEVKTWTVKRCAANLAALRRGSDGHTRDLVAYLNQFSAAADDSTSHGGSSGNLDWHAAAPMPARLHIESPPAELSSRNQNYSAVQRSSLAADVSPPPSTVSTEVKSFYFPDPVIHESLLETSSQLTSLGSAKVASLPNSVSDHLESVEDAVPVLSLPPGRKKSEKALAKMEGTVPISAAQRVMSRKLQPPRSMQSRRNLANLGKTLRNVYAAAESVVESPTAAPSSGVLSPLLRTQRAVELGASFKGSLKGSPLMVSPLAGQGSATQLLPNQPAAASNTLQDAARVVTWPPVRAGNAEHLATAVDRKPTEKPLFDVSELRLTRSQSDNEPRNMQRSGSDLNRLSSEESVASSAEMQWSFPAGLAQRQRRHSSAGIIDAATIEAALAILSRDSSGLQVESSRFRDFRREISTISTLRSNDEDHTSSGFALSRMANSLNTKSASSVGTASLPPASGGPTSLTSLRVSPVREATIPEGDAAITQGVPATQGVAVARREHLNSMVTSILGPSVLEEALRAEGGEGSEHADKACRTSDGGDLSSHLVRMDSDVANEMGQGNQDQAEDPDGQSWTRSKQFVSSVATKLFRKRSSRDLNKLSRSASEVMRQKRRQIVESGEKEIQGMILRLLLLTSGAGAFTQILWCWQYFAGIGLPHKSDSSKVGIFVGDVVWWFFAAFTLVTGVVSHFWRRPLQNPLFFHFVNFMLFICPAVFAITHRNSAGRVAIVWSFFSVIIQCSADGFHFPTFVAYAVMYTCCVVLADFPLLPSDLSWHDSMQRSEYDLGTYVILNSFAAAAFVVPLAFTVRHMWGEWGANRKVLDDVQKELQLEKTFLKALVPQEIVSRLLSGEEQIADYFPEASVLFVYLVRSAPPPPRPLVLSGHAASFTPC
jgi:class 3 adenylate cyclase